jgi:1-acyl-sn-glycerol-3-phosphate acyltransferase
MFYAFLRVLAFIVLMPVFFIKVIGKENFRAPKGGSVVIAHHTSNWDPIILGFVVKHKPVSYMAKEELYRSGAARFFYKAAVHYTRCQGKG